jgi:hypothetical protein
MKGRLWIALGLCLAVASCVPSPETEAPAGPADTVSAPAADGPGASEAVGVLERYYDFINRGEYERAHTLWGGGGAASGQTAAEFRAGFANTDSVAVTIGSPGRIDPAAGSRYVEIAVEIRAVTKDGRRQRFTGSYVLRRSVVDGATAEQRAWRIHSAQIREVGSRP